MNADIKIENFEFNKNILNKFNELKLKNINWPDNWPTIYIIHNNKIKQAYIGESYKIKNRILQHLNNNVRSNLNEIKVIIDNEANKSYTLDIESFLIR